MGLVSGFCGWCVGLFGRNTDTNEYVLTGGFDMAETAAAVQAQLGTNPMQARIIRATELIEGAVTDLQGWTVVGLTDAAGRTRSMTTTRSDSAAVQAAAILTALRA